MSTNSEFFKEQIAKQRKISAFWGTVRNIAFGLLVLIIVAAWVAGGMKGF